MATALLGAQGLTVGTYTSPNLSRVNERISRNGEPIDDDAFLEVLESLARLEPMMEDRPTRFELLTAAALAWFADEAVDVAVVEVGLGRPVGLHQRGRRRRGGAHQRELRPHRGAGPHPGGHRPGQVGHLQAGEPGGDRGVRPDPGGPAAPGGRRAPAPPRSGSGARTSPAPPTGWRSAGACIDVRTPAARLRGAAGPAARGPPGGERLVRAGGGRGVLRLAPPTRTWSTRPSPGCGSRAGSRWSDVIPWWWWTGPTTSPG